MESRKALEKALENNPNDSHMAGIEFDKALKVIRVRDTREEKTIPVRHLLTPDETRLCFELWQNRLNEAADLVERRKILGEIAALFHQGDGLANDKKADVFFQIASIDAENKNYRESGDFLSQALALDFDNQELIKKISTLEVMVTPEIAIIKEKEDTKRAYDQRESELHTAVLNFADLKKPEERDKRLREMIEFAKTPEFSGSAENANITLKLVDLMPIKKVNSMRGDAIVLSQNAFDSSDDMHVKLKALEKIVSLVDSCKSPEELAPGTKENVQESVNKLVAQIAEKKYDSEQHTTMLHAVKNSHLRNMMANAFTKTPQFAERAKHKDNLLVKILATHTNRFTLFGQTRSHKILENALKKLEKKERAMKSASPRK